ncbi:MAG: glycosyltransferase, partial [Lentisphaeria bacterium]|nr:glycosyltransferase [Lentisphaeria bacterium]
MKLSIVIINYKTPQLTINCLHSLAMDRSEFSDYDVWLIDNASGDNSPSQIVAAIRENNWGKWVHFRQSNKNIGFAAGNNFLIREILRRK